MAVEITGSGIDVGIVVRDEAAMLAFYRDFLGFEVDRTLELGDTAGVRLHFLRVGTARLKLVTPVEPPADTNPAGGLRGATGIRYITIAVGSLDPVLEGVEAAGGGLSAPVSMFGSSRIALVHDPEGNVIELLEGEPI